MGVGLKLAAVFCNQTRARRAIRNPLQPRSKHATARANLGGTTNLCKQTKTRHATWGLVQFGTSHIGPLKSTRTVLRSSGRNVHIPNHFGTRYIGHQRLLSRISCNCCRSTHRWQKSPPAWEQLHRPPTAGASGVWNLQGGNRVGASCTGSLESTRPTRRGRDQSVRVPSQSALQSARLRPELGRTIVRSCRIRPARQNSSSRLQE